MKLLTLNTHSLQEEHYAQKLEQFVEVVLQLQPDIIAMQEVNQSISAPYADTQLLEGFFPCSAKPAGIRMDNHAAQLAARLRAGGLDCSWTWVCAKIGYDKYDEGLALFSLNHPLITAEAFYISGCRDYRNWKTRKALGICIDGCTDWFFTVHMGWWQDEEEPFAAQWERLDGALSSKKDTASKIWLMGDFNSPAEFSGQGYDYIVNSGWYDTYQLAQTRDNGITVRGCIDGWRSFTESETMPDGMRMNHIWCSKPVSVQSSSVIFNGVNGPEVSDHFGVLVTSKGPDIQNKRRIYL